MCRSDGKAPDAKEPIKPTQDTALKETAAVEQTAPEPTTPPRPVEEGKLVYLKLSEVHPFHTFRPHPFKVRDDAKMQEIVASIRVNGVMVPGLARPEKDGNGYEIVAGHRRTHGSELAGLEEMPFIVREMTDHEAVQAMKDSNKQRDGMLPSELAALLELEVEDIKHQGGRLKGVAEGDVGKRSVEIVGEAHDMNYKKVMRHLRLNSLVPELLDKVDDKKMGFMPAVELSYIKPKNQRLIAVSIDGEQTSPSLAQAKRLRELDKEGKLNGDVIDGILSEQKKEDRGVIISTTELEKYFGKEVTPAKMKEQIMSLLDDWKEKQPPELAKAPKKQELDSNNFETLCPEGSALAQSLWWYISPAAAGSVRSDDKKRRHPIHLHVMVSEAEQALIQERMTEAGIRNMGAYMRKMALSGYVLHVDLSPVRELVSLQRRCSNNLNQVAIQANTYGAIYPEELAALQRDYAAL